MANTGYDDLILGCDLPWGKLAGSKILVTGANGLIASNLVDALMCADELLSLNLSVYALCRDEGKATRRFSGYNSRRNFQLVIQDVVEPLDQTERFNYIVHAASMACPDAFNEYPVDVMRANFVGTLNLLDAFCIESDTRFMFVSSSEVYGENEDGVLSFREADHGSVAFARFRACYPESKRAAESLCMSFKQQYGSDVVIVRPAFVFGCETTNSNTRADVYFLRQAMAGKDIVMYSAGSQIRSYLYVKDCVMGMLYALVLGESGGVYNIGDSDCVVTLREYAQLLADAGGVNLLLDESFAPQRKVLLRTARCVLDSSRLKNLGWRIKFGLEKGVADIFETE